MKFRVLTINEYLDIYNCIQQHINRRVEVPNGIYSITVWESDVANKYLNSNTPKDEYAILDKPLSKYSQKSNIDKVKEIWDAGLIAIEIIQKEECYFFALPRSDINNKKLTSLFKPAEYKIPDLNSFESLPDMTLRYYEFIDKKDAFQIHLF